MFQAAEVESQVRLLDESLVTSCNEERLRPSFKSNAEENQLASATGFYYQVAAAASQFAQQNDLFVTNIRFKYR